MRGPDFEELFERGCRFRKAYGLPTYRQAVNVWHDCVGHALFVQFTPPTLEGELLTGRHQHLVMGADLETVLDVAPIRFDTHLQKADSAHDPQLVARKDAVLAGLETYLRALPAFDNLTDYDRPFLGWLRRERGLQ